MNLDHHNLFSRILQAVDATSYFTPTEHVDPSQRPALEEVRRVLQAPDLDPDLARAVVLRLHAEGRLDRVHTLSALHVIAASPRVRDWAEAARLAGEQELAALDQGGPWLDANLASVDRHRGVIAFLRGHYEAALDHFTRALERQRTAENLGNVLAALLRLGELDQADQIVAQVRTSLSADLVRELDQRIQTDPDLAALTTMEPS